MSLVTGQLSDKPTRRQTNAPIIKFADNPTRRQYNLPINQLTENEIVTAEIYINLYKIVWAHGCLSGKLAEEIWRIT